MSFWNKKILSVLSDMFAGKYEEKEDDQWKDFLSKLGCEIVPVENLQEMCDLINLREDLLGHVALACDNDCEVILVPKDVAAVAVTLGELPEVV